MPNAATIALAVDVTTDAGKAVAGMGDVGDSARDMAAQVQKAGDVSEATSRKIGLSADAADELGGKAGKATGALGALSSGFELVGAEKYAGALQAAGMATDFMSGVGDSLNLVMESTIVQNARARVATIARTVAEKAATVGTAAMTAGQWALNAAMNANPVALIVLGVVALVAIVVVAYKKSETFRSILQSVGRVGKAAIGVVVNAVGDLVGWVRDRLPGAFNSAKTVIVTAVKIYTLPIRTLITVVTSAVSWVKDKLPAAFDAIKNKAGQVADKMLSPFRKLRDLVKEVLDFIAKIKIPKLPGAGGGVPFVPGIRASAAAFAGAAEPTYSIVVQVQPFTDPDAVAQKIEQVLGRRARRFGA